MPATSALLEPARWLLDMSGFPARWQCGRWSAGLGWLHIGSDLAIFAAYLTIPLVLGYFLARRRDFPFPVLTSLFAAFILSCGLGHAIEAAIFWMPAYRVSGVLKAITALISWVTVVAIIRILPAALELPGITRLNQELSRQIADRIQAERELSRSDSEARKLALIASRTDNAVILTDPDGRIEWVNDGFTRITGYRPRRRSAGPPARSCKGPRTDPAAVEYMRERQRRGEGFRTEILNYSKDGRAYWISVEAQPIHDEEGRLVHFMAIESDVTERKRAEEPADGGPPRASRHHGGRARPALRARHRRPAGPLEPADRAGHRPVAGELAGRPAAEFFPESQRPASPRRSAGATRPAMPSSRPTSSAPTARRSPATSSPPRSGMARAASSAWPAWAATSPSGSGSTSSSGCSRPPSRTPTT